MYEHIKQLLFLRQALPFKWIETEKDEEEDIVTGDNRSESRSNTLNTLSILRKAAELWIQVSSYDVANIFK